MKPKGVTTQMKALDEYFLMVLFVLLLKRVHVFAIFMFNLDGETCSERVNTSLCKHVNLILWLRLVIRAFVILYLSRYSLCFLGQHQFRLQLRWSHEKDQWRVENFCIKLHILLKYGCFLICMSLGNDAEYMANKCFNCTGISCKMEVKSTDQFILAWS